MCTETATVGLGYEVLATRAWLYDLDAATIAGSSRQRDAVMALCWAHANRITVPVGWELIDRRAPETAAATQAGAAAPGNEAAAPSGVTDTPLFKPRSRPAPAAMPTEMPAEMPTETPAAVPAEMPAALPAEASAVLPGRDSEPSSLLERAFRASPAPGRFGA